MSYNIARTTAGVSLLADGLELEMNPAWTLSAIPCTRIGNRLFLGVKHYNKERKTAREKQRLMRHFSVLGVSRLVSDIDELVMRNLL